MSPMHVRMPPYFSSIDRVVLRCNEKKATSLGGLAKGSDLDLKKAFSKPYFLLGCCLKTRHVKYLTAISNF